jgi:hypothetical protein
MGTSRRSLDLWAWDSSGRILFVLERELLSASWLKMWVLAPNMLLLLMTQPRVPSPSSLQVCYLELSFHKCEWNEIAFFISSLSQVFCYDLTRCLSKKKKNQWGVYIYFFRRLSILKSLTCKVDSTCKNKSILLPPLHYYPILKYSISDCVSFSW